MSNLAKELFDGLKRVGTEISAETSRLGIQGANEVAAAIFSNNAFVQYGPGQVTKEQAQQPEVEQQQQNENTIER